MKIAIGLSGGVDSSVAAALLKQSGHDVTGITMKIWRDGKYRGGDKDACFGPGEEDDIRAAAALCRKLDIPYHVFDCAEAYEKAVLDYFRAEYLAGRTPNPCVRCNSLMKFGVLPNLARQSGVEFDKFATGHYVRSGYQDGRYFIRTARDLAKDQSYFLYRLTQKQLAELHFPLGERTKAAVRALAEEFGLEVSDKPDSQDFYSGDHRELLDTPDRPGNIVDASGKVLGTHKGFWHYTVGQRRGLGIAAPESLYVTALNPCRNEVVVGSRLETRCGQLLVNDCNWVSAAEPDAAFEAQVKIRSASTPVPARLQPQGDGLWRIIFPDGVTAPAAGQSAVFYDGDLLLGGGVITEVL